MKVESFFIEDGRHKNQLHYCVSGQGEKALLAFHGFGQDHRSFKNFIEARGREYTIYTFDLFFHGKSVWKNCEATLSIDQWGSYIDILLSRHQIERFSLLGYSMGAKLALATLSLFPEKTEKLILIAPDGIKTNFWYNLATYPYGLRKIFRATITHPGLFFFLVKLLSKINFLEKGIARFAGSQMNSRKKRYKVYCTWIMMRKMTPDIKVVAEHVNQFQIALELYLGKHDRIIKKKNMNALLKRVRKYDITILEAGHNTLIDDVARL